jgi:Ner family transcriptional regulator
MPLPDWHPEDIKAAIRKTGITLTGLALENGLAESAVRMTLIRPWPRVEAIIAARLGRRPQEIWPSRYDAEGKPIGRSHHNRNRSTASASVQRQNAEAA